MSATTSAPASKREQAADVDKGKQAGKAVNGTANCYRAFSISKTLSAMLRRRSGVGKADVPPQETPVSLDR